MTALAKTVTVGLAGGRMPPRALAACHRGADDEAGRQRRQTAHGTRDPLGLDREAERSGCLYEPVTMAILESDPAVQSQGRIEDAVPEGQPAIRDVEGGDASLDQPIVKPEHGRQFRPRPRRNATLRQGRGNWRTQRARAR